MTTADLLDLLDRAETEHAAAVARAVAEERERCAAIADHSREVYCKGWEERAIAMGIAIRIREGWK